MRSGESKTREQEVVQVGSERSAPGMRARADSRQGRRRPELETPAIRPESKTITQIHLWLLVRMEGKSLFRLGSRRVAEVLRQAHILS